VTHHVSHNAWLGGGILMRGANVLDDIPGILVNGCFDFQAPIANAWELKARVAACRVRHRRRHRPHRA
jgi:proline iminopeptidase